MRTLARLIVAGLLVFAALQLVRPEIPVRPATAELQTPPEVGKILDKSCYSCHSYERRLAWFDQIVPVYWLVRYDILTARAHLNFSTLGSAPAAAQKASLYESLNMIQLGAMPLPRFLKVHPDAAVTPEELATLKAYLAPWTSLPNQPVASAGGGERAGAAFASLATIQPEFDGFPFDSTFESWKPISTTDRGDNNTCRFILGNDIAVKAAQSGNLPPWPDGTRFAKIAWQQELGPDGLVHPGKFVQVELMLKDARRFKDNEGWGWGRWRGQDLKPYGKDVSFAQECTGCHRPMGANDFVYTLPITRAPVKGVDIVNSIAAALPASLPDQPLAWNAITIFVDPKARTMSTLYGNETAIHAVPLRRSAVAGGHTSPPYPAGSVLALVTWAQRDDPHWFGARIPGAPLAVEFVSVEGAREPHRYRRFAGAGLAEEHPEASTAVQRADFILGLAPVSLP